VQRETSRSPTQLTNVMTTIDKVTKLHDAVSHNYRKATLRADMKEGGGYVIEQYDKKTGWVALAECKNYRDMMKKMREIRGINK
jgi:hypothetical protein